MMLNDGGLCGVWIIPVHMMLNDGGLCAIWMMHIHMMLDDGCVMFESCVFI